MAPSSEFYRSRLLIPTVREFSEWEQAQTRNHTFVEVRYNDKVLYGLITTTGKYMGEGMVEFPMGLNGPLAYPGLEWVHLRNRKATGWFSNPDDLFQVIGLEKDKTYGNCRTQMTQGTIGGVARAMALENFVLPASRFEIPQRQPPDVRHRWLALSAWGMTEDIKANLVAQYLYVRPMQTIFLQSSVAPSGLV